MANTYTALHYHLVFSTKNRLPWITPELENRLWALIATIGRDNAMLPLAIGGVEDHVHAVMGAPPTLAPSRMVQLIKGGSCRWVHETFPELKDFGWQDGYAAFSVSKSQLTAALRYVANQREHHRECSFQREMRRFLRRHGVDADERYLWG